jgi:hypothetical protein
MREYLESYQSWIKSKHHQIDTLSSMW